MSQILGKLSWELNIQLNYKQEVEEVVISQWRIKRVMLILKFQIIRIEWCILNFLETSIIRSQSPKFFPRFLKMNLVCFACLV